MSYPHQPGSPQFDGADAYEAYLDELERERAKSKRLEIALRKIAEQTFLDDPAEARKIARAALSE